MTPQLGDYMTVRTNGFPAWLIRTVTRSPVNHAAVYVGNEQVIEGRPSGAGYNVVTAYPAAFWSHIDLTDAQRESIVEHAKSCIGIPYNWLDDLDIGLGKLFGMATPKWIEKRLSSTRTLMCSQLVDACYETAGADLFTDGRPVGAVSPGDLYDRSH